MRGAKQIELKNRTYYFENGRINIEKFDSNLLKIDKKSDKDIDIYYVGYITSKKINDCENIYSVIPQMDILSATPLKKKMEVNVEFLILQMKTRKY